MIRNCSFLFNLIFIFRKNFKIVANYVNEIEKIISFYRVHHEHSDTSLPLLLVHGPNGSGKLRTAEALAAKLSMHFCKVN
jgi:DNA polymerase III delta prime subunit